ncbi:unnamed protein product [Eruca vesicaria subsp. sativa]|uniref:Uncharacterized protein n=1 Tax=Eruca vesicaria subsp. sativa TaxID=29727 RepID=A0ABC8J5R6_ERUVS|nr:unnamed protein product [Eruca vesicaria subsp. sativa]
MSLSPDGSYLLTSGMDNKLCVWDMRPYAPKNRCVKIFEGHQHNFEKNLQKCSWSPDGTKVTAGSADRMVHIWDTTTRRILYKLLGHKGSVNDCVFTHLSLSLDLAVAIKISTWKRYESFKAVRPLQLNWN